MSQKQGSGVQTMPEYGGTLPEVIASFSYNNRLVDRALLLPVCQGSMRIKPL